MPTRPAALHAARQLHFAQFLLPSSTTSGGPFLWPQSSTPGCVDQWIGLFPILPRGRRTRRQPTQLAGALKHASKSRARQPHVASRRAGVGPPSGSGAISSVALHTAAPVFPNAPTRRRGSSRMGGARAKHGKRRHRGCRLPTLPCNQRRRPIWRCSKRRRGWLLEECFSQRVFSVVSQQQQRQQQQRQQQRRR